MQVGVVGCGVSGLAAAHYLLRTNVKKVLLLEGSSRIGGWVQSTRLEDGTIFEHGPQTVRAVGPTAHNTLELVEELGLSKDVQGLPVYHPGAKNRYIYAKGKLFALPNELGFNLLKKQAVFSKSIASIAIREILKPRGNKEDESVDSFFKRRFGNEVAEYIADPMCRGVFAGNSKQLSIQSCMPDIYRYEQEYGSVVRGALKSKPIPYNGNSVLVHRSKSEKWVAWALHGGLQRLTDTLAERVAMAQAEICTNAPCQRITFSQGKAKLSFGQSETEVDHVVCAVLAKCLAPLIWQHPNLATLLSSIPAVTVAVVNLEYKNRLLPVQGFGHLVPSTEPSRVLGVIYSSCLSEDPSSETNTRLTVMLGGEWFQQHLGDENTISKETLATIAMEALDQQLKIKEQPVNVIVHIQKDCIPQYRVGHGQLVRKINDYIATHNLPLSLIGASYSGPGINDCTSSARRTVEKLHDKYKLGSKQPLNVANFWADKK